MSRTHKKEQTGVKASSSRHKNNGDCDRCNASRASQYIRANTASVNDLNDHKCQCEQWMDAT